MSVSRKCLLAILVGLFLVQVGVRADLIAHYTFDDGEPTDEAEGNDGIAAGDAMADPEGVGGDGEAFRFGGAGHIVIPIDINSTVYPQLTVTMWVKADDDVTTAPALYKTFGHDDGGWDRTFGLDNRNGPFRWAAFNGNGITQDTGTPVSSEWTFLAAVWDVDTATVRFHANENWVEEPLNDTFSSHLQAAIGNLRPDNFSEGWRGLIDEVQIYDEALEVEDLEEIRAEIPPPETAAPEAVTRPAGGLGEGTATLRGTVNPKGLATMAWFEYGLTTNYGMQTPLVDVGSGFGGVSVTAVLDGLEVGMTYHYRVVAENAMGTSRGDDESLLVPDSQVLLAHYTFEGGEPTDVSGNGNHGTVDGDAVPADSDREGDEDGEAFQFFGAGQIEVPIDINPTQYPDMTVSMWVKADELVVQAPALYKTFGHDDGGWDRTFGLDNRNGPFRWAAFTGMGITQDTGTPVTEEWTFLAAVWDTADDGTATVRFHAEENYVIEPLSNTTGQTKAAIGNLRPDNFSEGWQGLIDDVRIYGSALTIDEVDAVRTESGGVEPAPPEATTLTADDVAPGTATLRGRVVPNGATTTVWFEYGLTTDYGMTTPEVDAGGGFSAVSVDAALNGLELLQTYHYRVVAKNEIGTTTGEDESFEVPETRPLLAHYTFEGGEAEDVTGNGNDGMVDGDALPADSDRDGDEDGEAFQFFGQGHIVIPIDINPTVYPDLTVTMWARADETIVNTPGRYKTFGHDDGGWDRTFGLDNREGNFRWAAFTGGVGPGPTDTTGTPLTSEWTFLAAVWDTAPDGMATVRFHADDLSITEPLNNTPGQTTAAIGSLRPDNFAEGFVGLIDDVRIYTAALSEDEIEDIREGVTGPPAPHLLPGDVNGDSNYDLSDPVAQLGFLFAGGPLPECYTVPGPEPQLTEAGLAILDYNGDTTTDITDAVASLDFLFSGGLPPALGVDCVQIESSCEDTCR